MTAPTSRIWSKWNLKFSKQRSTFKHCSEQYPLSFSGQTKEFWWIFFNGYRDVKRRVKDWCLVNSFFILVVLHSFLSNGFGCKFQTPCTLIDELAVFATKQWKILLTTTYTWRLKFAVQRYRETELLCLGRLRQIFLVQD